MPGTSDAGSGRCRPRSGTAPEQAGQALLGRVGSNVDDLHYARSTRTRETYSKLLCLSLSKRPTHNVYYAYFPPNNGPGICRSAPFRGHRRPDHQVGIAARGPGRAFRPPEALGHVPEPNGRAGPTVAFGAPIDQSTHLHQPPGRGRQPVGAQGGPGSSPRASSADGTGQLLRIASSLVIPPYGFPTSRLADVPDRRLDGLPDCWHAGEPTVSIEMFDRFLWVEAVSAVWWV